MPTKNTPLATQERFIIARNAHELLREKPELFKESLIGITSKKDWQFTYAGDPDFKKYFRGDFQQVSQMIEFYEQPEAFLASINTKAHLKRAEVLVERILGSIPSDGRALIFATLDAYSLTLTSLILQELGAKNRVLSFLSSPTVNGSTKSFEAYLLLLAYTKSPSLSSLVQESAHTFKGRFDTLS
jgi:hypothetical protein